MPLQKRHLIIEEVEDGLRTGRWIPGDLLPTTLELANKHRVSVQTAQSALKELVTRGYLRRTRKRGTEVVSTPTQPAERGVALFLRQDDDLVRSLIDRLKSELSSESTSFFEFFWREGDPKDFRKEESYILWQKSKRRFAVTYEFQIDELLSQQDPDLVWIHMGYSEGFQEQLPKGHVVRPNYYQGARLATRHLIDKGLKRVHMISIKKMVNVSGGSSINDMRMGYIDEMQAAGLEKHIYIQDIRPLLLHHTPFRKLLDRQPRCEGVYCAYDHRALDFIEVAKERSLKIPGDVALVSGYNTQHARKHGLTSVDYGYDVIGREIARLIERQDLDRCKQQLLIEPMVIERESSRC